MTKRPANPATRRKLTLSRHRYLSIIRRSMLVAIANSDFETIERARLRLGTLLVRATARNWPNDIGQIRQMLHEAGQTVELNGNPRTDHGPQSTLAALRSASVLADRCQMELRYKTAFDRSSASPKT